MLKPENKIFKIETSSAIRNFKKFLKNGDQFLIDRGDLSKEVKIENIPVIQRDLFYLKKKNPGNDLLFHVLRQSTIGANSFHLRVRNGIGCLSIARVTRKH